jgi:hypothetical protein
MYLTRFRLAQYRFRVTHVLFSLVVSLEEKKQEWDLLGWIHGLVNFRQSRAGNGKGVY